ncbi:hypothetical protein PSm6_22120 [Pseudomonas solani]|uniref:Uncharacterized protein n=1 Tax=Pseudomonas solani TaxID=2731552 RepID=A0ABN6BPG6_9PSED|nr:hypothetical protein PSm6_22120 [Pseudomonas solani]
MVGLAGKPAQIVVNGLGEVSFINAREQTLPMQKLQRMTTEAKAQLEASKPWPEVNASVRNSSLGHLARTF